MDACQGCSAPRPPVLCPVDPAHGALVGPSDAIYADAGPPPAIFITEPLGLESLPLGLVLESWKRLGCDQNGRPMLAEMNLKLDGLRILDHDERALWEDLWTALSDTRAAETARLMEKNRPKAEGEA